MRITTYKLSYASYCPERYAQIIEIKKKTIDFIVTTHLPSLLNRASTSKTKVIIYKSWTHVFIKVVLSSSSSNTLAGSNSRPISPAASLEATDSKAEITCYRPMKIN